MFEHDGECRCARCEREAVRLADERAQRTAAAIGGIAPWAHTLLGVGWIDADGRGGNVPEPIGTEELAQRALADVFEQLERVACVGREKCRGPALYTTGALTREQRVKRHEVVSLLRFCENALDYARVHLDYLECEAVRTVDDARHSTRQFVRGDRVMVSRPDDDCTWCGTVVSVVDDDERVEVRADDGEMHNVPWHFAEQLAE